MDYKNNAGHAGSRYKLYILRSGKFEHFADIGNDGIQILKHKGLESRIISLKDFRGVK